MDTSARDIRFDENGICSYCLTFERRIEKVLKVSEAQKKKNLQIFVDKVKRSGKGKPYDCIVGVSGGVDSSWVLAKAVQLGLRPLAVHMDNGWDSELAQHNIANLISKLHTDLYTHVIDWAEYRQLMQAFFDADVIDIELLYDNAMLAVNYRQARKYRIKYILSGSNTSTEGMIIPPGWNWYKYDVKNLVSIAKQFGNVKIRTFPKFSTLNLLFNSQLLGIKWVSFLDMLEYDKADVLRKLESEFGYKPYPYKHYESIFTRFYQGYILPKKFNVDKRRLHFSTLILTGQMSRTDAVNNLSEIPYSTKRELQNDIDYFLKKMRWSNIQLEQYLNRPERGHYEFPTEISTRNMLKRIRKMLRNSEDPIKNASGKS